MLELALDRAAGETITDVDLRTLSELRAEGGGIADLTGLEHATALESVYLADLSPLAGLASLVWLHLREPGTPFENLQALEGLTELYELTMGHGGLVDISPLAELTAMRELDLGSNRIQDLEPLGGLESLRVLDLRRQPRA